MARRKRITFTARGKRTKPVRVSFTTRAGEKVYFRAKKTVTKPVKVIFMARAKGKKK
jgi:hypothetical protein